MRKIREIARDRVVLLVNDRLETLEMTFAPSSTDAAPSMAGAVAAIGNPSIRPNLLANSRLVRWPSASG
jgi:hypothetical protein